MAKNEIKITKQDLETDEVLEFTDKLLFFLKMHGSKLLYALAAVFIVYAGFIFANKRSESTLRAASDRFYTASTGYSAALMNEDYGTSERQQAMEAVATDAAAIRGEFEDAGINRASLFLEANAYYFAGDKLGSTANTEKAIALFSEYEAAAAKEGDNFERASVLIAIGKAYENLYVLKGSDNASLAKAAEQYDAVLALDNTRFLRYEAMVGKARVLDAEGKQQEAIDLYKKVVTEKYEVTTPADPEDNQSRQLLHNIRNAANNLTTAAEAQRALVRLGMEPEDVDKLAAGNTEETE